MTSPSRGMAFRSASSSPMPTTSAVDSSPSTASSLSPTPPASTANSDYFLRLSAKFVHFDPVTKGTSVFFDDIQCQIFVVRDNGSAGVRVHSPIASRNFEFAIENKGTILSIKFSPDFRVLAVQRSNKSVEFLNFSENRQIDLVEYSQVCRARSAKILGFCWVSASEIVLITDTQGLESYAIRPEKKSLRSLKNYSVSVNWFLYMPPYLLLSSGPACNILHVFLLRNPGNYQRFNKFEIDIGAQHAVQNHMQPNKLLERDVVLAPVYGLLYVLVIKQVSKLNAGAEVVMYQVKNDGSVRITDILLLECNGRFAVNVLDNLIVVHHQQSKMSKIFDLKLNTRGDSVKYHFPVSSYSIEPYHIKLNIVSIPYELYSSNWAVFLPSIIVDAKLGCLWQLELKTDSLACLIADRVKRIEFLLLRDHDAKSVLIKHLAAYLHNPPDFPACVKSFELLNQKLKQFSTTKPGDEVQRRSVHLEQVEVFRFLLLPLSASLELPHRNIVAVLVEYLRSLLAVGMEPQYYVQELIVNTMVQFKMFHLLRHCVENGVFCDSKPFACLLLSLENMFPPAVQMVLDMLKRLGSSVEEQVEILLAKNEIFAAMRLLQAAGVVQHEAYLTPRKFLEPALTSGDRMLFYSVFRYFQMRNNRLRGSSKFLSEELCDDIVFQFETMFPEDVADRRDVVF
ncbi:regulator of MON1-CCZ1 complex-like [Paramacrobiotus metropolitanus]|uniref:regulator of MON1-CCZ1 complex-like n=1 Tax=Paramacrobiotus metropolitanus TaxID=2943436 RepID=UPI0024460AFE|nr:regulator of MON1-CCZ1 complex-like [Paramacrobiotus metropolitanus]